MPKVLMLAGDAAESREFMSLLAERAPVEGAERAVTA